MISKHKKPFVFSITCVLAVVSGPTTGTTILRLKNTAGVGTNIKKIFLLLLDLN